MSDYKPLPHKDLVLALQTADGKTLALFLREAVSVEMLTELAELPPGGARVLLSGPSLNHVNARQKEVEKSYARVLSPAPGNSQKHKRFWE